MHRVGLEAGVELPPALCHGHMSNYCDLEKCPGAGDEACFFSCKIDRTVAKAYGPCAAQRDLNRRVHRFRSCGDAGEIRPPMITEIKKMQQAMAPNWDQRQFQPRCCHPCHWLYHSSHSRLVQP